MLAAIQGALNAGMSKVALGFHASCALCAGLPLMQPRLQAIIVGSDIPDISTSVIQAAAAALDQHEVRLCRFPLLPAYVQGLQAYKR